MFRLNVQNINKEYHIYAKPHHRLLQALLRRPMCQVFEVLNSISFAVGRGQSLGIIGDNGAGKSTLLKLLAGTVQPTAGSIDVNGRIAALLELGAGFHPEFTGRQNIYLNASLLGISRKEIDEKEQSIIEFAELEQFIDRPVRTYSSGMYVRLAFSIATMVDPDILIIDEALAVGDISFQKKCMSRMNEFKAQGKTMLFCSHSMYHVQELCDRAIWLENGRIRKIGRSDEVVAAYQDFCNRKKNKTSTGTDNNTSTDTGMGNGTNTGMSIDTGTGMNIDTSTGMNIDTSTGMSTDTATATDTSTDTSTNVGMAASMGTVTINKPHQGHDNDAPQMDCRILSFTMKSADGKKMTSIKPFEPIHLEMSIEVLRNAIQPSFGFAVMNDYEEIIGASLTNYNNLTYGPYIKGQQLSVRYVIDFLPLRVGSFMLLGAVSDDTGLLWYDSKYIGPITVEAGKGMGTISLKGTWKIFD